MRALCFTVDFDRDVNVSMPGRSEAGSLDRGSGTGPRFTSSYEGARLLSEILDDMGIRATFFVEGRTFETVGGAEIMAGHEIGVHGYDHEDLVEVSRTGGPDAVKRILSRTSDSITDAVGTRPRCFRAPYMKIDDSVIRVLPDAGLGYDSSVYTDIRDTISPSEYGNGVIEVPSPEGIDAKGRKISSYLWQMHEGKRVPKDYLDLASGMTEGVFVLSTHSWHMTESRSGGMMDADALASNTANVRSVLEGLCDMGFSPMTVPDAAGRANRSRVCALR